MYHCAAAANVAKGAVNVAVTVAANTFCCFYLSFAFAAHRRCHNCLCLACFSFYLCSSRVLIVFLYTYVYSIIYVHCVRVCVRTRSCIDSRSETSMTSNSHTHTIKNLVSRSLVYSTHIHTQTCIEYINARMYLYRKKGQTANSLRKAKYKQSSREQLINSAACARSFNVSLCVCMSEYERGSSRCKSFPLKTSRSQSSAAHSLLALSRALSLCLSFSGTCTCW